MAGGRKQLGQMLTESGKISEAQLAQALQYQRDNKMMLGKAVVAMGLVTENELLEVLGHHLGLPHLELMKYNIDDEAIHMVPEKFAREHNIIPLFALPDSLTIATADPLNIEVIDELSRMLGVEVSLVLATEMDIERAIDIYYRGTVAAGEGEGDVRVVSREIDQDKEIVQVVDMLLGEAVNMGASDIHIEPRRHDARIR